MDVRNIVPRFHDAGRPRGGSFARVFFSRAAGYALLTLAAALALWLFVAAAYHKEAVKNISEGLNTINSYKTRQLRSWLNAQRREAVRLSQHSFLGDIVLQEISNPGSRRRQLAAWLTDFAKQEKYSAMAIMSPEGATIAATAGFSPVRQKVPLKAFAQAADNGEPSLTDLYLAEDGRPRMALVSPVFRGGKSGKTLCVVVALIDPETDFYPLIKATPLFFRSAETLLVRREGDKVLYLNKLKHIKNSALKLKRPLSEKNLPAAAAFTGRSGFFEGVDYRGIRVFSAIGALGDSDRSVVTKIDRDEVLAPVKAKERLALAEVLLLSGLIYALVYLLLRYKQKAAEAALANSRYLLAETEQIGKVGGWEFNIDTGKLAWTREVYRIHEFDTASALDIQTAANFYTPESKPVLEQALKRALEAGENFDLDLEIITGKGNRRAVHTIGRADLPGRRVYGFLQDITERKRAEELVRKSEHRLAEAERIGGTGSWEYTVATDTAAWSDNMFRIFDVDPAMPVELVFKHFVENTVHPEDRGHILSVFRDAIDGKRPYDLEYRIVRKDGSVRNIHALAEVLRDGAGKALRLVGRVEDITEKKSMALAITQSEERLRLSTELANVAVWEYDFKKNTMSRSANHDGLYMLEPQARWDINTFLNATHPDDRGYSNAMIMKSAAPGGPDKYTFDFRVVHEGRPARWLTVTGQVVERDAKGQGLIVRGCLTDITARKLAELELERVNRDLLDKKQEMENFLYITTHDLRTPLVNIQGFSQNLETYFEEMRKALLPAQLPRELKDELEPLTGEHIPKALNFVLSSSRKMDALITALLKVSRAGRVEMRPETLDMNSIIEAAISSLNFQLTEAGGAIKTGPLPACKADRAAVSQIFMNLLDNAIKYRHKDRAPLITVKGEAAGGMARYSVADNASGIPENEIKKIWNVFYRQDRAPAKKGEGIGLPMVRRMVEKNGGDIRVESKEGEGSVFYLELPAGGS